MLANSSRNKFVVFKVAEKECKFLLYNGTVFSQSESPSRLHANLFTLNLELSSTLFHLVCQCVDTLPVRKTNERSLSWGGPQ